MNGLIVHEWLASHGGSERVVDAMRQAFPAADLLALWNDAPEKYVGVHESWLARSPLRHHKAWALSFMPHVWRHVVPPTDAYDWVLVSSHLFAHHVDVRNLAGERVPKFVYTHTPARYIWEPELDERGKRLAARGVSSMLKPLDFRRAQEAISVASNSRFVQERVRRVWHRSSSVIYPPVDVELIQSVSDWRIKLTSQELSELEALPEEFILGASRFIPYKRLDWVIRAGAEVGIPVVIAGGGPEEAHLREIAEEVNVPVRFVIDPSTPMLYALYQAARLFVFPAIEDFGIMPVEAQAAGTAVVTTSIGGATESHQDGVTGVTASSDDPDAIGRAVAAAMDLSSKVNSMSMADRFGRGRFCREIQEWVVAGKWQSF